MRERERERERLREREREVIYKNNSVLRANLSCIVPVCFEMHVRYSISSFNTCKVSCIL